MEETFLDRLKVERAELTERTTKLDTFIKQNATFNDLTQVDQDDLKRQLWYMQGYLIQLTSRLNRLNP